jgi:hypothetical protein
MAEKSHEQKNEIAPISLTNLDSDEPKCLILLMDINRKFSKDGSRPESFYASSGG